MAISDRVREVRIRLRMSQREFGRLLGVSAATVSRIERGMHLKRGLTVARLEDRINRLESGIGTVEGTGNEAETGKKMVHG